MSAFITHADCARHEMGPHHPECPERLGAINDHLLVKGLLDYMHTYDAPLATEEQLGRAHSSLYVRELFASAPSEGYYHVDPDTNMNPWTLKAALRAAGAAVKATDLVISGEVPTAFCSVRPPGHHAEHAACMGFCFFNNVAVGMRHALDVHGLQRVALIDFDVHHGNGTEDIVAGDERILMASFYQHPFYPVGGARSNAPNLVNVPVPARTRGMDVREIVEMMWIPRLEAHRPELIFISAGFDAHRSDDLGQMGLVEQDFVWITSRIMDVARQHANGRIVSCLEGGYNLSALARSVEAHIRVLAGR